MAKEIETEHKTTTSIQVLETLEHIEKVKFLDCWYLVCGFVIIYELLYWNNKIPTEFTLLILLDYFLKVVDYFLKVVALIYKVVFLREAECPPVVIILENVSDSERGVGKGTEEKCDGVYSG